MVNCSKFFTLEIVFQSCSNSYFLDGKLTQSPCQKIRVATGNKMLEPAFAELCREQLNYICTPFEIIKSRDSSTPVGDHWVINSFVDTQFFHLFAHPRKLVCIVSVSRSGLFAWNRSLYLL